jgi:hypothetical protein
MWSELLPFSFDFDTTLIAGMTLWSLALYLGFFPLGEWLMEQLSRWFNFADGSLYTSKQEFERTRKGRESQNAFYASILSTVPFLIVGGLLDYGMELSLGRSWAISLGILACIGCGIYELGRRDGQKGE